ncbi:hypothetical protein JIN04_002076 [Acinetobacter baumannii]|nr:hypothetical protein [Acinetobacter baumannii]EKY1523280.1 hypothetical protein [Acinetobacter baumannii]
MNALAGLSYDNSIEHEKDVLGGFRPLESGVYEFTVKLAYFETSKNGATGVNCTFESEDGKTFKEVFYATNRNGENFYIDKQSGEKRYLAGFIHADALCLLTVDKPIAEVATEQLVVKLYNEEAKAEVPTKVDAITEIMGEKVKLGILKQRVNKTKYNESTGKREPLNEERIENVTDKVFRASDNKTTAEIRAQVEEAEFMNEWLNRWEGKLKDRYKEVQGGGAGAARTGAPRGATSAPRKSSLFA